VSEDAGDSETDDEVSDVGGSGKDSEAGDDDDDDDRESLHLQLDTEDIEDTQCKSLFFH